MEVRRYNYDVRRATTRESLARMLKRCKVESNVRLHSTTEKLTLVGIRDGGFVIDTSEPIAHLNIRDVPVSIALNVNADAIDFDAYGTPEKPVVALYPDHLLPQAEEAYDLYVMKKVRGDGIYFGEHLELLQKARKFIENGKRRIPGIWVFPQSTLPILIGVGLEDTDYAKWKQLARGVYVDRCIVDRATTYLLQKVVGVLAMRDGLPMEISGEIARLSEIAFGPIPLARLGEYATIERGVFYKILSETYSTNETEFLRMERERIKAAARNIIRRDYHKCGKEFNEDEVFAVLHELKAALQDIEPIYLEEEKPVIRVEKTQPLVEARPVQPHENVVQLRQPASPPNIIPKPAEVIRIYKLELREFIAACKNQFIGSPIEILTALHDIAKNKELNYTIDHPENLIKLIEKYRSELRERYFDVNSVLEEMAAKNAKLARAS